MLVALVESSAAASAGKTSPQVAATAEAVAVCLDESYRPQRIGEDLRTALMRGPVVRADESAPEVGARAEAV